MHKKSINEHHAACSNNLDRFWRNQEVHYNFRCDITRTRNRSL